jgi:hypothetical protein
MKRKMAMPDTSRGITAERLRELFNYDPGTGVFTRRVRTANCVKVGDVTGHRQTAGYIQISVDRRPRLAHRIAWCMMTGESPKTQIDHINLDKADNRWCNLREATQSQNFANTRILASNGSGFKGRTGFSTISNSTKFLAA